MRNVLCVLSFAVWLAAPSGADEGRNAPQVIRMTVRPAGERSPALKYQLVPPLADLTPGNAALLYYHMMDRIDGKDDEGKLDRWLQTPPADLPRDEVQALLRGHTAVLDQADRAGRRTSCQWEFPIREEGLSMVLPPLSRFRHLGKLLALKGRLAVAEGRFDEAVRTLQTGIALARHQADAQILINGLVGVAIADLMLQQVQALSQAPEAPNLYWALASLGSPVVDLRNGIWHEGEAVYFWFPAFRDVRSGRPITREHWEGLFEQTSEFLEADLGGRMAPAIIALKLYPHAKRHLAEQGRTAGQIEAMPVRQVVVTYMVETFGQLRDDVFKWFLLPYPEARAGLRQADRRLAEAHTDPAMPGFPLTMLLPSVGRSYFVQTRLERRAAVLRCIESVRMYAASHGGRPPGRLEDIRDAPAPPNPLTGQPFGYRASGQAFTLDVTGPADAPLEDAERYEVTVVAK